MSYSDAHELFETLDVFSDGALHTEDLMMALDMDIANLPPHMSPPCSPLHAPTHPGIHIDTLAQVHERDHNLFPVVVHEREEGTPIDGEDVVENTKEAEEKEEEQGGVEETRRKDCLHQGWVHVQKKQDW